MEKKIKALILFLVLFDCAFAQSDSARGYVHKNLLRATLTFAVGKMTAMDISNAYITGNMEYYTDRRISIRGDAYYFIGSINNNDLLKMNHAIYFGSCYNFAAKSHFNPFIGFQPGTALCQMQNNQVGAPITVCPLASLLTGFNFYGDKYFHLFINLRYSVGEHLNSDGLFPLNEVSVSFGLGWNLNLHGKK